MILYWTYWQDSPTYGCRDNPSYQWFAMLSTTGHIAEVRGPFPTEDAAIAATRGQADQREQTA
jgi:hypothetical protein